MDETDRRTPRLLSLPLLWRALAGLAFTLLSVMEPSLTGASAQSPTPSLRFVNVSGYRLTVEGRGWPVQRRLIVAFHAGSWLGGLEVQTTLNGSFRVGMNSVDRCGTAVTAMARDFNGHARQTRAPALLCPPLPAPPSPALTLLQGPAVNPTVLPSIAPTAPGSVTIHRRDLFYLWEPGTDQPAFTPTADEHYLLPIGQGRAVAPGCTQNCDPGFFWQWVAVKAGLTAVDLSPGCRKSSPPCAAPDLRIDVQILS